MVWSINGVGVYLLFLILSCTCRHYYLNCSSVMLWYTWMYNVKLMKRLIRFNGIYDCINSRMMWYLCDLGQWLYNLMKHAYPLNFDIWWFYTIKRLCGMIWCLDYVYLVVLTCYMKVMLNVIPWPCKYPFLRIYQ